MGSGLLTFLTNMRAAGKKSVIGKEVAAMNFASPLSDMLQLANCIGEKVIGTNCFGASASMHGEISSGAR
ncbi:MULTISPECIES: hypothetical protein [Ochrobactrum]|uniref:hypothetical protein n=1 Tax=Ochrobactrum sp. C6C9 TaxID=2736662 RepID=UPI003530071F|nr:hypothetical protein [Ochrobactrum sp. C6C9]